MSINDNIYTIATRCHYERADLNGKLLKCEDDPDHMTLTIKDLQTGNTLYEFIYEGLNTTKDALVIFGGFKTLMLLNVYYLLPSVLQRPSIYDNVEVELPRDIFIDHQSIGETDHPLGD